MTPQLESGASPNEQTKPTDGTDFKVTDTVQHVNHPKIGVVMKLSGAMIGVAWEPEGQVMWYPTYELHLVAPRSIWVELKNEKPAPKALCVVRCSNGRKYLVIADPDWAGGFCQRNHYHSKTGRAMFKDTELPSPVTHWFGVPEIAHAF